MRVVDFFAPYCKYHYARVPRWRWVNVPCEYPVRVRECPICDHASMVGLR